MTEERPAPTILTAKQHDAPSIFVPANLLLEARRQRGLPDENIPAVCALNPDGDIVRALQAAGAARHAGWACYHTDMYVTEHAGLPIGVVGCAVGAPFAVLVAEQLFVSGCKFLVSVTSAGQIAPVGPTPYFVLIDRALRDEGTSYHYLPPAIFSEVASELANRAFAGLASLPIAARHGRPTRHTAKPRMRLPPRMRRVCLRSKWRRRHFMPSPARAGGWCCALPM